MSFKLKLHFKGLCLFNPHPNDGGVQVVHVVFLQTTGHMPRLVVDEANVPGGFGTWGTPTDVPGFTHLKKVFLDVTDELTLKDASGNELNAIVTLEGDSDPSDPDPETTIPAELRYFRWLPAIKRLYPDPDPTKRPAFKGLNNVAGGRIRLGTGNLFTSRLFEAEEGSSILDFVRQDELPNPDPSVVVRAQRIAHEITYESTVNFDGQVFLTRNGNDLRLEPRNSSERSIRLWFHNNPDPVQTSLPGEVPKDFEPFYGAFDVPANVQLVLPRVRGMDATIVVAGLLDMEKISFPCSGGCTC